MNLNSNPTLCSSVDSSLPSLWSPPVIPTSQSSVTIHRHIYNHHQASTDLDRTQNLDRSSRSALQLLTSDPSNAPSSGSRSSLHLLPGTPRPDQVSFIISSTDLQPEPITLQSSKEKTPDLDCSICFSQFNNVFRCPKLLQCHHTFCLECLARMNMKSSDPTTIQCPLCRHYTPLPAQGVPKLPTDYNVLYCLPAPMQRVNSIHFIRNEGKLHVKRSAEVQEPGGQSSLPVTLENESVDVEQPSLSLDLGLPSRSLDTVPSSRSLDVELSSSSPDEELPIRSREVGRLSRHLDVRPPGHSQGRPGELVRMDRGLFSVMEWLNSKMPFIMIIMGVLIFIMTFLIGYRESF